MKKIICMLAMALLTIGAAQAQEGVRKMVVRQNDGKVLRIQTANIEEVTFEEASPVPTTVEEAEAMLVGYWKWSLSPQEFEFPDWAEASYFVITEELKVYWVFKVADSVPDEDYTEYAGKYVVYGDSYGDVIVNSVHPTSGTIFGDFYFKNLDQNCFDAYIITEDGFINVITDFTCSRVKPFEYIIDE